MVGEETIDEPEQQVVYTPQPTQKPQAPDMSGMFNILRSAALVLNARGMMLLALIGAIVLGYLTVQTPDPWRIGAECLYDLTVLIPMIWHSVIKG